MKKVMATVVVIISLTVVGVAQAGWTNGWYQTKMNIQGNVAKKWNMYGVYCFHGEDAESIVVSQNVWWSWFGCAGTDKTTGRSYAFRALITGPKWNNFQIARLTEMR